MNRFQKKSWATYQEMFPVPRENAGTIYATEKFQPRAAARRGAARFTCLQSGKLGEPGPMELTKTRKDANKSVASRCNECVRMKRQKSGLKMGQRIRLLVNPDCERAFITATPGEAERGRGEKFPTQWKTGVASARLSFLVSRWQCHVVDSHPTTFLANFCPLGHPTIPLLFFLLYHLTACRNE